MLPDCNILNLTDHMMYSVKPQLDSSLTINIRLIEEYNVSKVDLLEQSREDALYQAAMIFNMYYSPIVIVIGLIGNSLSLFVMLQVSRSKYTFITRISEYFYNSYR